MGTLFNQLPRNQRWVGKDSILDLISEAKEISKVSGLSIDQVLKSIEILELRRQNAVNVDNGDIHDEQMAGIGKLLEELSEKVAMLSDVISDRQ